MSKKMQWLFLGIIFVLVVALVVISYLFLKPRSQEPIALSQANCDALSNGFQDGYYRGKSYTNDKIAGWLDSDGNSLSPYNRYQMDKAKSEFLKSNGCT